MRRLFLLGSFLTLLALTQTARAADSSFVRIPSTLFGPSGLLITQSTDTLSPGALEIGLGASIENASVKKPDSSFTEYLVYATATAGITSDLEAAAQIPYIADSDRSGKSENNIGDVNLSLKWRFFDPSTDFNFPGFAFSATVFLPTGDHEIGAGEVDSWGLKALLVSSAEAEVTLFSYQMLMGFYADGGIYLQDSGDPTEEKHGIVDLGILVPLHRSGKVHLLLEANARINRETAVPRNPDGDYTAIMPGLRYVTQRMAFTAGWPHRFNSGPNEDSDLFLFQGSYLF